MMKFRKQIQMIFQDPYSSLNGRLKVKIIAEPIKLHNPSIKNQILKNYILIYQNLQNFQLILQDILMNFLVDNDNVFQLQERLQRNQDCQCVTNLLLHQMLYTGSNFKFIKRSSRTIKFNNFIYQSRFTCRKANV